MDVPEMVNSSPVPEDPTLRSAPAARPRSYQAYLASPWWKARRNQALRDAKFRCQRCGVKRDLQVHHRSYQRLGAELPTDLEVVCRGCHLGHHYDQAQTGVNLYARIISDTLRKHPDWPVSDLLETAKMVCAKANISLNAEQFHVAAVRVLHRVPTDVPMQRRELYERRDQGEPLSRAEAAAILLKLGSPHAMKHMPEAKPLTRRKAEYLKAYRLMVQAISEQEDRCREAEAAIE